MRWSARAVAGWAVGTCLVSWGLSACLSPTLPLPPPGEPKVAVLSADGKSVRIEGHGALPGASVIAVNEEASLVGEGGIGAADTSGNYVIPFFPVDLSVHKTNKVRIWQMYGSDQSDEFEIFVPYHVAFGAPPDDDGGTAASSDASAVDGGTSDAAE